jgi:hypothetical protein
VEIAYSYHKRFSIDVKVEVEEIEDKVEEKRSNTSTKYMRSFFAGFLTQDSTEVRYQTFWDG